MARDPFYLGSDFGIPRRERPLDDVVGDSPSLRAVTGNRRSRGKRDLRAKVAKPKGPSWKSLGQSAIGAVKGAPAGAARAVTEGIPAAYNYFRTSTPGEVLGDVQNLGMNIADQFRADPIGTTLDFTPFVGDAKAVGDMLREAALARDAGDTETAAMLESLVAPVAAAGFIPEAGALAVNAARKGLRAARGAPLRGALTEAAEDLTLRPEVVNRLYNERILGPEYQPGDALPAYGYRNISNPDEIRALLESGYMLPPEGRTGKYFTMSDREVPAEGNIGAGKPILRVHSSKIPQGRAVSADDVELWDDPTSSWMRVRDAADRFRRGGLAVKKGRNR